MASNIQYIETFFHLGLNENSKTVKYIWPRSRRLLNIMETAPAAKTASPDVHGYTSSTVDRHSIYRRLRSANRSLFKVSNIVPGPELSFR